MCSKTKILVDVLKNNKYWWMRLKIKKGSWCPKIIWRALWLSSRYCHYWHLTTKWLEASKRLLAKLPASSCLTMLQCCCTWVGRLPGRPESILVEASPTPTQPHYEWLIAFPGVGCEQFTSTPKTLSTPVYVFEKDGQKSPEKALKADGECLLDSLLNQQKEFLLAAKKYNAPKRTPSSAGKEIRKKFFIAFKGKPVVS